MSDIQRQIEEAKRAAASSTLSSRSGAARLVSWLIRCVGALILSALTLASLAAWFYFSVGPDGTVWDGFGRQVYEAPFMLRLIDIDHWRGLGWFLFDIVAFWSALGLGVLLVTSNFGPR